MGVGVCVWKGQIDKLSLTICFSSKPSTTHFQPHPSPPLRRSTARILSCFHLTHELRFSSSCYDNRSLKSFRGSWRRGGGGAVRLLSVTGLLGKSMDRPAVSAPDGLKNTLCQMWKRWVQKKSLAGFRQQGVLLRSGFTTLLTYIIVFRPANWFSSRRLAHQRPMVRLTQVPESVLEHVAGRKTGGMSFCNIL